MVTANTASERKVENPTIRYRVRDLIIGIDNFILAYDVPVQVLSNTVYLCRGNFSEQFLRDNVNQRLAYQTEPVKRCLDPNCPPAKKALDFLERRVEADLRQLPESFRREQSGEQGVYRAALRKLKREITALKRYLSHYVVMDD
jgi:hypothetical protein